jgi:nucleoside-diphosphate-sugar epimerase
MRVLVTGATGFIGQHLCHHLVDQGHSVVALVRTPSKTSVLPVCQHLVGDLSLFKQEVTLPEVDVVVHLAGVVAADTLEQYAEINRDAVQDLVDCLDRQTWTPRRLVFASSLAAAGPSPAERPWNEGDTLAPIDPYGQAKKEAEELLKRAPFPTTSFRPPLVFGPNDPASLTLYQAAQKRVGVRVAGPPQRLSWVDVRDAVDGIRRMVEDTRDGHHTYYLGSPWSTDLAQLWKGLGRALNRGVLVLPIPGFVLYMAMRVATAAASVIGFRNQLDEKQYTQMRAPGFVCDSQRLMDELDWRPQHRLEDTLGHAVAGYRALGQL